MLTVPDIVRLKGEAASGSVVLTVMVSISFGIILASYRPSDLLRSTWSTFLKYGTFLLLEHPANTNAIRAVKAKDKAVFFMSCTFLAGSIN